MRVAKPRLTLASVFFTFFIDNLSWAIVFPIFAPYFLDSGNAVFSSSVSAATRTTLLGFFLMAFSLGQFLGAPLLGEYADRKGRKKALVISTLGSLLGLALSAWSMQEKHLWLLFAGRLLSGMFAGNLAICVACVGDLSANEAQKAKRFGKLSLTAGVSFVLGAFLGGKLSDSETSALFSLSFPLWVATFLTVLNFLFIVFACSETGEIHPERKFDLWEGFRSLRDTLKTKRIRPIYGIYFLFLFAWMMLFQFTPVLVVDRFGFTSSNIGDLALFMGVCWALGSGYLHHQLLHWFKPLRVLEGCFLFFTAFCVLLIFLNHVYSVLAVLGGATIIGGLGWPLCTGVISSEAPKEVQGKVLGMSQSVQSLAMALAPAVGGVAYQLMDGLPFLLGALASLGAGVIYLNLKKR
jgi:DHA1 family tetracycline resistance protein-like MFS transporter